MNKKLLFLIHKNTFELLKTYFISLLKQKYEIDFISCFKEDNKINFIIGEKPFECIEDFLKFEFNENILSKNYDFCFFCQDDKEYFLERKEKGIFNNSIESFKKLKFENKNKKLFKIIFLLITTKNENKENYQKVWKNYKFDKNKDFHIHIDENFKNCHYKCIEDLTEKFNFNLEFVTFKTKQNENIKQNIQVQIQEKTKTLKMFDLNDIKILSKSKNQNLNEVENSLSGSFSDIYKGYIKVNKNDTFYTKVAIKILKNNFNTRITKFFRKRNSNSKRIQKFKKFC
jgi:hypothetical protein